MPCEITTYNKALNYAFRLLKIRLRSSQELRNKLKNKKYSQDIIDKVLKYLNDIKFIDDKAFSLAWAKTKINNSYGLSRINFELKNKGIAKNIIASTFDHLRPDYNEIDIINRLIERRLEQLKDLNKITIKRRLYGFLKLRGFSGQAIIEALNNL